MDEPLSVCMLTQMNLKSAMKQTLLLISMCFRSAVLTPMSCLFFGTPRRHEKAQRAGLQKDEMYDAVA